MIALDQIPYHEIGVECSGIVTAVGDFTTGFRIGDRVCALTESQGSYANRIRTPEHKVSKIPETMDFTTAASIPVVFTTALYALRDVARLSKGESVLIHAAAGGVGQAAIQIAQNIGAEIFVTVGSTQKQEFLEREFDIPRSHIFSSRDTTFGEGLLRVTQNRGVDVILNSVAGEALRITWDCLAPLGRFVEIGKRDLVQNNRLEMNKFLAATTFSAVEIGILAALKPDRFRMLLGDVIAMFRHGRIRPVSPIVTYPMSRVQEALRRMQMGKHMGKIVIKPEVGDVVQVCPDEINVMIHFY